MLLGSPPDMVHGAPSRRARPSYAGQRTLWLCPVSECYYNINPPVLQPSKSPEAAEGNGVPPPAGLSQGEPAQKREVLRGAGGDGLLAQNGRLRARLPQ